MNWHPAFRRAVLLAAALALAGCAGPPTFRGLLKERYPGYDQILPAATALPNEPGFDYLPGNILALSLAEAKHLAAIGAVEQHRNILPDQRSACRRSSRESRKSVKVVYDFDRSLRKALGLSKLKTSLQLEPNEIEVLRRVTISVDSPKIYSLARRRPAAALRAGLSRCAGVEVRPAQDQQRAGRHGDDRFYLQGECERCWRASTCSTRSTDPPGSARCAAKAIPSSRKTSCSEPGFGRSGSSHRAKPLLVSMIRSTERH